MADLARAIRPEFPAHSREEWLEEFRGIAERTRYTTVPVLLVGGPRGLRESVARLIHQQGPTRDGDFVALNCGSVSSGANPPWFAAVAGPPRGTLFLDSLERLPLTHQRQLFAWLESPAGPACRAGDPVRCRVMAGLQGPRCCEGRPTLGLLPELFDYLDKWTLDLND